MHDTSDAGKKAKEENISHMYCSCKTSESESYKKVERNRSGYLNFGALRSFVLAFFSLPRLKSVIEFNNCARSSPPPAGVGGGAAATGIGGGGGGGGAAVLVMATGGAASGDCGRLVTSTLKFEVNGCLGVVLPVDSCNGSTLTERCRVSVM